MGRSDIELVIRVVPHEDRHGAEWSRDVRVERITGVEYDDLTAGIEETRQGATATSPVTGHLFSIVLQR